MTDKRNELVLKGICRDCHHNSVVPHHTRCQSCLDKNKLYNKKQRELKKQQGICTNCQKRSVEEGYTICSYCRETNQEYAKSRRVSRKSNGCCTGCGEPLVDLRYKQCAACRAVDVKKITKYYHHDVALGICPQCRKPRNPESPSTVHCTPCYEQLRTSRVHTMSRKRYGGNLEQVIERDKGCVICGAPWRNDVTQIVCHHIDEDTSNNDPSNLVMLCRKCHGFVTFFMQCSDRQAALAFLHKHYL